MPKNVKKPRQVEAFRKAACDLGADDSEARFDTALRAVAQHRQVKPVSKPKTRRRPAR